MTTFFDTLEDDVKAEILKFEQFFDADVWPYVKAFFSALLSQEGVVALRAAVADIPEIVVGNEAAVVAAVGSAVASTLAANAAADASAQVAAAEANLAAGGVQVDNPNAPATVDIAETSSTPGPDSETSAPNS